MGRRYACTLVVRWPGHIKPGTVKSEIFASLDWLPTLVDIAGGPKGDELKHQIEGENIQGSSRPRLTASTSATTWKAVPPSRPETLSSTIQDRHRRRCGTRTGRFIFRWQAHAQVADSQESKPTNGRWLTISSVIHSRVPSVMK